MTSVVWGLVLSLAILAALEVGHRVGRAEGKLLERYRAIGLCQAALNRRFSGSVRWVLNALVDDRETLLPEVQFFGPNEGGAKGEP
jgi:hypothetical protein